MWRHDRSTDLTTDITDEFTGTLSGDGQGEGRDNAAGLAAANRRIDLQSGRQTDQMIGQMIGQRIGQRIAQKIDRRTGRRIGRRIDRATTSLTPYGMSVWALILAACGGGGGGGGGGPTTSGPAPAAQPQMLQREGYVYDGPVKGAVVYVDVDGDGQLNPGIDEYVGTTNNSGAFRGSISAQNRGKRYIVDLTRAKDLGNDKIEGTEDDQDLSGFDTWLAPEGASVVSALTHLIATGFYQEQEVRSTFQNFDPLRENPYNEGLTPEKEKAFEVVRKALPNITSLVQRNSELIRENARRIDRNSEDLKVLKDQIEELKRKFKAVTDAARQQQEQEEATPTQQPEPAVNTPTTGQVGITGTVREGQTLTADTGNLRDADGIGSFTYQWKADGRDIAGATGANYRLTASEIGKVITVEVTHTDARGGANSPVLSAPSTVTEPAPVVPVPAPPTPIQAPDFTSGAAGTDLTEHATGQGVQVYDANAAVGAGSSGQVRFSLKNAPNYLAINAGTGVVTLTGPVDLDAMGEASRTVRFTVVATDSADPGRTKEQSVSFTITNSNEQPTGMTVTPITTSFSENADKANGLDLARATFDDDDPVSINQSNFVHITRVTGRAGHRLNPDDFGVRREANGDLIIFLKESADTTITADTTFTVTFSPSTTGHGTVLAKSVPSKTFQFTLRDVDHDPVISRADTQTQPVEAKQYIQGTDTGVRFRVTDEDGNISPIQRRVDDSRFFLVVKRDGFRPDSGNQEWQLWIQRGSSFMPGETINLTITAYDEKGRTTTETVSFTVGGTAQANAKPTGVALETYVDQVNEGQSIAESFVLARITVRDDGQGNVDLTLSGSHGDLFEIRPVEGRRGIYDLHLKSSVTLDQSRVGTLSVDITATGDGTGADPDPVKFELPVRNVEYDPVVTKSGALNQIAETTDSAAADTGLRFSVTDADGNFTGAPVVNDGRFELKPSEQEWQLWVKAGQTFRPNEAIILTVTATDQNGDTGIHRVNLQVVETPSQEPANPPQQPATFGADLDLFIQNPGTTQNVIYETTGDNRTDSPIFTGFHLSVSKSGNLLPQFFHSARNRSDDSTQPKYEIHRKSDDGTYVEEDRFVIRRDGKFSVKRDVMLDFEAERDANADFDGLIELRITITDGDGDEARFNIGVQLTNVNEHPYSLDPSPAPYNRQAITLMYQDGEIKSVYNPYAADRPRLLPNTEFSVDKTKFHDIDGDNLYFNYIWTGPSSDQTWAGETFTPTQPGRYTLELMVSDRPLNPDGGLVGTGGYGLRYVQSFTVYKPTPVIGDSTSISIDENATRDSALATINFDDGDHRISGEYYIYSVNGRLMNEHPLFRMDSRGSQLWLKTPETTLNHEAMSSYEIVLRHAPRQYNDKMYGDLTFTLTVEDVPEAPEIQLPDGPVFYFIQNSGSTNRSFSLFDSDLVVSRREVSAEVGYRLSDDRFELKQQYPLYITDSFGDLDTRQFYKIVAKQGQSFKVGETISLTITALDNDNPSLSTTQTVTIHIVTVDGSWTGRNIMTGTANQDDVFVVDTTPDYSKAYADTISGFEDGRDKVKFSTDIGQIWTQRETSGGSTNILIRNSNNDTVNNNILAVINDFDGTFDSNDLSDNTITVTALPEIS